MSCLVNWVATHGVSILPKTSEGGTLYARMALKVKRVGTFAYLRGKDYVVSEVLASIR